MKGAGARPREEGGKKGGTDLTAINSSTSLAVVMGCDTTCGSRSLWMFVARKMATCKEASQEGGGTQQQGALRFSRRVAHTSPTRTLGCFAISSGDVT